MNITVDAFTDPKDPGPLVQDFGTFALIRVAGVNLFFPDFAAVRRFAADVAAGAESPEVAR